MTSAVLYEAERSAPHFALLETATGADALALVSPMAKAAAKRASLPADDIAAVARIVLAQTLAAGFVGTMATGAAVKRAVSALARDAGRDVATVTVTGADVEASPDDVTPAQSLARARTPNGAAPFGTDPAALLALAIPLAKAEMTESQRAILRALAWHDGWQSGRIPSGAIARDVIGQEIKGRRLAAFSDEVRAVVAIMRGTLDRVMAWHDGRAPHGAPLGYAAPVTASSPDALPSDRARSAMVRPAGPAAMAHDVLCLSAPMLAGHPDLVGTIHGPVLAGAHFTYPASVPVMVDRAPRRHGETTGPRRIGTLDSCHRFGTAHSTREAASLAIADSTLTTRSLRPVAGVTAGMVTGAGQRAGQGKVPAVKRSRRPGRVGSTGPTVPMSGR